jgi:hypothetical protein
LEKKEYADKNSLQAQRNDWTMQPLYAWSRFFFLWARGATEKEVPLSEDRWHSDHHLLGGLSYKPATPHACLGYQALNRCNSFHQACEGSFPAIIRLMRTPILPPPNYTKKLFLPTYEKRNIIYLRFCICWLYSIRKRILSIRKKWSHLFQTTRSTAMSTIFYFYEYWMCSSLLVCLNLNSAT